MELIQPPSEGFNPLITTPLDRTVAYWQRTPDPIPTILSFEPAGGAPGVPVTLRGSSFTAATEVRFRDTSSPFTVLSDTVISTAVPDQARTGPLRVSTADGTGSSLVPFHVAPVIARLLPGQAPEGTSVSILGFNFTGATQVSFNGLPAAFTVVSDTLILAVVPTGLTRGPVSVTGPGGTGLSADHFVVGPVLEGLWTMLTPPGGREFMIETMVYDPNGRRMIVVGGETWELKLDGGLRWQMLATQTFPVPSAIFDPDSNRVVAFGGDPFETEFNASPRILDLSVNPPVWGRRSTPAPRPHGRLLAGVIYDPVRHQMVMHGGYIGSGHIQGATWVLSLRNFTWTALNPVGDWPYLWAHAAVYDPSHDRMVIYGGRTDALNGIAGDVWALPLSNPVQWIRLFPQGTAPPPRAHTTCAYDAFAGGMVIHGGWRPEYPDRLNDTWILELTGDTPVWREVPNLGDVPPPLSHQAGAVDPDSAQLVVMGGFPPLPHNSSVWSMSLGTLEEGTSIAGFSPAGGPVGTPVTVSGSGLSRVVSVRFGAVPATFTIVGDTELTTSVPAGARSNLIFAVTPFRTARSPLSFYLPPLVTHLSPPIALPESVIAIRGTGLSGTTSVTFNGGAATFTIISDELITATVPAGATSGPVAIVNPGGSHVGPSFTVAPTPQGTLDLAWDNCGVHGGEIKTFSCAVDPSTPFPLIASFRPPPGVRDLISLTGEIHVSAVTLPDWWKHGVGKCRGTDGLATGLGGTNLCSAPWGAGSSINWAYAVGLDGPGTAKLTVTASVPAGGTIALDPDRDQVAFRVLVGRGMAAGSPSCSGCSRPVRLDLESIRLVQSAGIPFNPIITAPASRATAYWQGIPAPPPAITSLEPVGGAPGTVVTIRGRSLSAASAVLFHSMSAIFSTIDDTTLTAVVPPGARTGHVSILTVDGSAQSSEAFHVAPRITSFAPIQAPIGHTIRVVGQNFGTTSDVRFGPVATTYETILDTLILAVVPEGTTPGRIFVVNPGGADTSTIDFTVGRVTISEGINLSWDDCGDQGVASKIFACDANTGPPFTLVASFAPPAGIEAYLGLSALLTIGTSNATLPEWWKYGSGFCRSNAALSSNFDFLEGPYSCQDVFAGAAVGGYLYEVGYPGAPSKVRLRVQAAVPLGTESALDPGFEYYGFKINLSRTKTTGSGSCSGCEAPVCIQLNEIQLFQPDADNNNPTISLPMSSNIVSWQGATSCFVVTPVQVALVTAEAIAGEVRLAWELPRGDGATLYRREGEGEWTRVTRLTPDGDRRLSYVDREVRGGMTYGYRLGIMIGDEEIFAGETSVTVPARVAKLALSQVFWSGRSLNATVALPAAAGARFEVFDLGGRRAFSSALDHLEAGEHHLEFSPALRPGVYFGRLSQGGTKASARFVVVQ